MTSSYLHAFSPPENGGSSTLSFEHLFINLWTLKFPILACPQGIVFFLIVRSDQENALKNLSVLSVFAVRNQVVHAPHERPVLPYYPSDYTTEGLQLYNLISECFYISKNSVLSIVAL